MVRIARPGTRTAGDEANLLEQTRPPFEDVLGKPGEPNILAREARTPMSQQRRKIDPRGDGH